MMTMYTTNKPAVRDSFDDDDVSDDVDDEVFIRDGRNGFKMDEERGAKRPLMAPRRKVKSMPGSQFHPEICKQPQCRTFCVPCCYGLLALVALFGLVILVVVVINMFPFPLDRIRLWSENIVQHKKLVLPCTDMKTQDVWIKTFPKLTSEASLKLNDVNRDGIQDIIVGYGTGADDMGLGEEVCPSYLPGVSPCLGGVMALDGRSGSVLWQHWTHRGVLYVDCSTDITADKTNDCVISGKGGVLSTLNGRDGTVIWELKKPPTKEEIDVYAVQFIGDVDYDLVPDILTTHSSIQGGQAQGHLLILNGRSGSVLAQVATPNYESVYSHPVVTVGPDGSRIVLLSTGSIESPGGLYAVSLHLLTSGNISQSLQLLKGGINEAPVLVDLNKDGTEDIVAISEDRVTVIDGVTLEQMWNTTLTSLFGKLQLLNSPTPAYFNDDDVPDILFTHMVGTSYPEYFFAQTTVVDGRTGAPLLDQPLTSSASVETPGLTLSVSGQGNDFFLYWVAVCVGHEETQQRFAFVNSTPIKQRVKADLCKLRFNSTLDMRLYALSQHTAPPGLLVYSSGGASQCQTPFAEVGCKQGSRWPEQHNNSWVSSAEPQQPMSNFHHKGDSVEHLKASPHRSHNTFHRQQFGAQELPISLEEYERFPQRRPHAEWHPQESAYGSSLDLQNRRFSNLGMYSNILNEGLPELEPGFGQDGEEVPQLYPPGTLGRDEREDSAPRTRRSISSRGLPHIGSAGALVPSLDGGSVDVVLTTHWLPASSSVYIRLPRDEQCIQERMARISPEKYDDLEVLRATVEEQCLLERGVSRGALTSPPAPPSQLTVCRLRLACSCDAVSPPTELCARILPYAAQSWPQRGPNVYFRSHSDEHPVLA